jgi:hypothetical protein
VTVFLLGSLSASTLPFPTLSPPLLTTTRRVVLPTETAAAPLVADPVALLLECLLDLPPDLPLPLLLMPSKLGDRR